MSIVCVKNEKTKIVIAADSITVRGATQSKSDNKFTKLIKINDLYIGAVGLCEESSLFQVFCSTHKPESATESAIIGFLAEFAEWKKKRTDNADIKNSYIFIISDHVFAIQGYFVQEIFTYTAIGAGEDFALAALYLGHNPIEAVKVACELSIYCEEPIKHYEIEK